MAGECCAPTKIAAQAGQVVAFGFIGFGILRFFDGAGIGGLWIAFIGWFLLQAARESYAQIGIMHALKGVRAADVAGLAYGGWPVYRTALRGTGIASDWAALLYGGR